MNINNLKYIVAPATLESIDMKILNQNGNDIKQGQLISKKSKAVFPVADGVADFTYPAELKDSDKEFNIKYDENALFYDEGMNWLFSSFFETEENVRTKLVSLLNLKPGSTVLNLGCGTGSDSVFILRKLNGKGKLFNLDLSHGLIKIARKKLGPSTEHIEYFIGNAAYLPFRVNTFNAVFHFGGINIFSEKKKAIDEMMRVTKPGGRIVFGDESAAPWLKNKLYGKIIKNANQLYKHNPPVHLLPQNANDVSIHYLLGNAFYAIAFTAGETVKLNLDLPIPGKRGGTLRSRYEANYKKLKA